jgi:ribosomal protein L7/L12
MERSEKAMNPKVFKILKAVVGVASLALPFASNYFENKDLKELVAKEVAEALKKQMGES